MKIDRSNFTHYYLQYLEGRLDPAETAELLLFRAQNPDIDPFDDNGPSVYSNGIYFPKKELLRKGYNNLPEINEGNFDEFCIARLENQLGEKEKDRLEEYIRIHPEKLKDARLIELLKLVPDRKIQFSGKEGLKKALPLFSWKVLLAPLAVAASIAAILFLMPGDGNIIETQVDSPLSEAETRQEQPVVIGNSEGMLFSDGETKNNERTRVQLNSVVPSLAEAGTVSNERSVLPVSTEVTAMQGEVTGMQEHEVSQEYIAANENLLAGIEPINLNNILPVELNSPIIKNIPPAADRLQFTEMLLTSREKIMPELGEISLWQATELAVKGFNFLTESDLFVERTPADEGKVRIALGAGEKTLFAARFRSDGL